MKVTAIKQQVKRQGRYSIFVEGKYAFSFSEVALLEHKISIGQKLTHAELKKLEQASTDDKVYNAVLTYAMLRPRSTWEMEQYLRRKKCSPSLSKKILNKLSIIGLLDDEAFARSWVNNRRLLKAVSRRRLSQELRVKRVSEEVAEKVLAEDGTDEQSVLSELVARKRKQTRYQDNQRLMQYLAGQGFNYGDIKDALESASD